MIKILLLLLIFSGCVCFAQIHAVTEKGDTVLLNQDGSWEFVGSVRFRKKAVDADTNKTLFTKPVSSRKVLKGQHVNYELWYDAAIWKMSSNEASEYSLMSSNGVVLCSVFPEEIGSTIDEIKLNVIANFYESTADIEIMEEEYRIVNGKTLYMMKIKLVSEGVESVSFGYFYSGKNSTVSIHAYTLWTVYEKQKQLLEDILNGLVINENN